MNDDECDIPIANYIEVPPGLFTFDDSHDIRATSGCEVRVNDGPWAFVASVKSGDLVHVRRVGDRRNDRRR